MSSREKRWDWRSGRVATVVSMVLFGVAIAVLAPRMARIAEEPTWQECTRLYGLAKTRADTLRADVAAPGPWSHGTCGAMRAGGGPLHGTDLDALGWVAVGLVMVVFLAAFVLVRRLLLRGIAPATEPPLSQHVPPEWIEYALREVPIVALLPPGERARLVPMMADFCQVVPVEGCAGFVVDDPVRLTIAAQAAVLLVGRGGRAFRRLKRVLVYPTGYEVPRTPLDNVRWATGSIVDEEPRRSLGESWGDGVVVLSWERVVEDMRTPHSGRNLVWHEFAHQVDQADGTADGVPGVLDWELAPGWRSLLKIELDRVRSAAVEAPGPLREYAGENEAEFFAVATETFVDTPHRLKTGAPGLYDALRVLYRIDPATWWTAEDEGMVT